MIEEFYDILFGHFIVWGADDKVGRKTGIELPSETSGSLASPETSSRLNKIWTSGNVLQAAIGQGDNAFSPLQIAKYIAMVANGGNKINPTIIKTILNADGTETSKPVIEKYTNQKLGLSGENGENIEKMYEISAKKIK